MVSINLGKIESVVVNHAVLLRCKRRKEMILGQPRAQIMASSAKNAVKASSDGNTSSPLVNVGRRHATLFQPVRMMAASEKASSAL